MSKETTMSRSSRSWLAALGFLFLALLGGVLIALSIVSRGEGGGSPPLPVGFVPEVRLLKGHTGPVHNVRFASNARLVSGSGWPDGDRTVRLWDLATGQEQARINVGGMVHSLDLTPDGRFALIGLNNGVVHYVNLENGMIVRSLKIHGGAIGCVAFSADGKRGVSTSDEGTARLWDLKNGKILASFTVLSKRARGGALLPGERQLLTGDHQGQLQIWDLTTQQEVRKIAMGGPWMIDAISLTSDGGKALVAGVAGVRVHDLTTGNEVRHFQENTEEHHSAALSADDRWLLTGGMDGQVRFWDFKQGELLTSLGSHNGFVFSVALSADSRLAASGGGGENREGKVVAGTDHDIRLWSLPPLPADTAAPRPARGSWLVPLGALLLAGGLAGLGVLVVRKSQRRTRRR
jgi:WD40 repeat protein